MEKNEMHRIEDDKVFTNPKVENQYFDSPLNEEFFAHLVEARKHLVAAKECITRPKDIDSYLRKQDEIPFMGLVQIAMSKKALTKAITEVNTCLVQNRDGEGNTFLQCKEIADENGKHPDTIAFEALMSFLLQNIPDRFQIKIPDRFNLPEGLDDLILAFLMK